MENLSTDSSDIDKSYREVLDFLFLQLPMFQRVGPKAFKKDLDNIISLSGAIGDPHLKFRSIHIAGTNGKGSTAHIIASVLTKAGYKTGLYTSPHYTDYRERIRINGEMISREEVIEFVTSNRKLVESIRPSFFEWSVAMAFDHFAKEQVDFAVIETGLGGRLDSTNIITPDISVITNIGLDHTEFLGDSLEKIAYEKAGIIKRDIPVVVGEYHRETWPVFEQVAKERNAPLYLAGDLVRVEPMYMTLNMSNYEVLLEEEEEFEIHMDLSGKYQQKNLITSLAALHILRKTGRVDLGPEQIAEGCSHVRQSTGMKGRWEVLGEDPLIIADAAHNEDGIRVSLEHLEDVRNGALHIVWGMVGDKPIDHILKLLPSDAQYYFGKADIPRGMDEQKLQQKASEVNVRGFAYPSIVAAYRAALAAATPGDTIFVGGSIFTVAEIIDN